jgi:hypothetical protein
MLASAGSLWLTWQPTSCLGPWPHQGEGDGCQTRSAAAPAAVKRRPIRDWWIGPSWTARDGDGSLIATGKTPYRKQPAAG